MTTTILRPNADFGTPSSIVGAATMWQATNDDSDASYVRQPSGAQMYVGLTTKTFASGEITKSVKLRSRLLPLAGTAYTRLEINGAFVIELATAGSSPLATYQSSTLPITVASSLIDSARVEFNSGDRFYEFYVDLVTVAKPVTTITAIAPDPYTASTMVPVSWANTLDSDGGAQTRYHLYVTNNSGGATVFDTGEVVSSATSKTVGPLANGTYTARVRVGQTVNGATHWSSYSTDVFTVTVTTSAIASVTATPNNTAGKIALSVARSGGSQAWEFIEIERSIDAGTTWSPVRGATFVDATGNANTFTIDDYETPNGQATIYRARATWYSSGLPITGAWVQSSSATWTSAVEWLKSPFDPTLNVGIDNDLTERVTVAGNQRSTNAGVFQVLGRADAITVADVLSRGTGALTLRATGRAQMLELDAILESTGPLLLNLVPDSMSGPNRDGFQYVTVLDVNDSPVTQYSLGNDEEMRLYEVTYANGITPPDETAGSV